jgi:hypothetical protein
MMSRRFARFVFVAGPIVLVAACTDVPPSAPTASAVAVDAEAQHRRSNRWMPGARSGYTNGNSQASLVWCQSHPMVQVSGNIGPAGGTIVVGNARLTIPPGAITQTVHFTATQPGGYNAQVTFEPSGLQFKKPAGLAFDVSGCNVSSYTPDIVLLNDEGVIVERIPATYSNYWHQVAAPVKHFSTYALAW